MSNNHFQEISNPLWMMVATQFEYKKMSDQNMSQKVYIDLSLKYEKKLSIYFVLTSIRIYNKNLHFCSFKLIQVNKLKIY